MCSYDSVNTEQQNEDGDIEKELLNLFNACDETGTDYVKVSQLIDKIKLFLQGTENAQEILTIVKLKLDPYGNQLFISKEYFIQCVSEWLDCKQQQDQPPVNGHCDVEDDSTDDDNVFFPIADIDEDESNNNFNHVMKKNRWNIIHSTPIIKKPKSSLHDISTTDVYLSHPDSPSVSIEAHTLLENEIKDMKQDMVAVVRERDHLEITVSDLRNHISILERNESLLTQTVNKLKTEVEKKRELVKCNEELVKINNDAEKEMANVNKKFASLVKTCEDQKAQHFVLEQMNLRLELLQCKSSATKVEEKYMQMKLNMDHWLKNFGSKNMKGSLGSPEEISLISSNIFGFSPVKYENSLMAEIGSELDDKNETDEDCVTYETLSTQTDFVDTKHYEDAASQTEDVTSRNKRRRVCEKSIQNSLTFLYLSQVVDHCTQTVSNSVVNSSAQTGNTLKRMCNVSCGDDSSFDICDQDSQTLSKSSHEVDATTQTDEPSEGFQFQTVSKKPDTARRGKKWIWFGATGVMCILVFYFLYHTLRMWSCNSPCCMNSGQYLWSLKKLFLSRNRNTVPV